MPACIGTTSCTPSDAIISIFISFLFIVICHCFRSKIACNFIGSQLSRYRTFCAHCHHSIISDFCCSISGFNVVCGVGVSCSVNSVSNPAHESITCGYTRCWSSKVNCCTIFNIISLYDDAIHTPANLVSYNGLKVCSNRGFSSTHGYLRGVISRAAQGCTCAGDAPSRELIASIGSSRGGCCRAFFHRRAAQSNGSCSSRRNVRRQRMGRNCFKINCDGAIRRWSHSKFVTILRHGRCA